MGEIDLLFPVLMSEAIFKLLNHLHFSVVFVGYISTHPELIVYNQIILTQKCREIVSIQR